MELTYKHLTMDMRSEDQWIGSRKLHCAYILKVKFLFGQLDNVIADLLVFRECLGGQSLDVINGMLPTRWGLRRRQGCHIVCGEPGSDFARELFEIVRGSV